MPHPLTGSVRNRLVLLFFAITSAAVGFVYLYVVPQLSSSLTAERLERLERRGVDEAPRLERAAGRELDRAELSALLRRMAADVDARVTLLGTRASRPAFVIADSGLESEAIEGDYPAAHGAAVSGAVRSAVETRRGVRVGESAIPIPTGPVPEWVAVLSTPLDDVEANVALIRRQILIAGAIALAAALLAGWLTAAAHARRLRRLEDAAVQVAEGNFRVPIPVGSDDEVGELAVTLDKMQARLARLDSARREFIANASHELRTPIASLGGFVELLEEEEEPDRETRREFVRTMRTQIDRLTKLSTDLLDLSKLDSDALSVSREPVDLMAVVTDAADEFSAAAGRAGATIEVGEARGGKPLARADLGRTLQIMRILIDNAIKHTPPGTRIEITTEATADSCRISVSDDGPGIAPEARERVFERFYTADSAGGSGLGLAIARELARLMGGDLTLASSRRGRTTFTLALKPAGPA
jgi:two-component system, OmpR family, sensor kinase